MSATPNVLMIVCDQLAPHFTGPYGHPAAITPNMDRLAAEGVTFDSAYSPCPICLPARMSLMTGRYASRVGCYDNASILSADQPTLCHHLAIAGYETALSGKMHFAGPDQLHGFERRLTTDIYPSDMQWLPPRPQNLPPGDYTALHTTRMVHDYLSAGPRQWGMELNYDEEVQARAREFLRDRRADFAPSVARDWTRADERPFFLCVSFHHPHDPFHAPQRLWDLYEDAAIDLPEYPADVYERAPAMDQMLKAFHGLHTVDLSDRTALYNLRRAYLALTTYIDEKVGELLDTLEDCGLAEDTVVLFLSDHGDMLGERGMIQKRTFYEHSARIPLLVRAPGRFAAGSRVPEPASMLDLPATVLELAGLDPGVVEGDGVSLAPLMEGERDPERAVFAEYHGEGVLMTNAMVRRGRYKLMESNGFPARLYDLENDPGEWQDLADDPAHAAVREELQVALAETFDLAALEEDVQASRERRQVIRAAKAATGAPQWDYDPPPSGATSYYR